jgi:hypothetical protein
MYITSRLGHEFDIFIASAPSVRPTAHYQRNAEEGQSFATLSSAHHLAETTQPAEHFKRVLAHTQAASFRTLFMMQ